MFLYCISFQNIQKEVKNLILNLNDVNFGNIRTFPTFFAQFPAAPKIDDDVTMQLAAILNFFSCHLL